MDEVKLLTAAMDKVAAAHDTSGVKVGGGKKYTMVVDRVNALRQVYGLGLGITTHLIENDGKRVVMKAVIKLAGETVGSGYAEEVRGDSNVNKTSALENAETSAIGRALACIGLAGGEYASGDEMQAVTRKSTAMGSEPEREAKSFEPPKDKIYLAVPFDEKADAKAAGAWWDGDAKKWYTTPAKMNEELKKYVPADSQDIVPRDNGTDASESVEDAQAREMSPDDEDDVPF